MGAEPDGALVRCFFALWPPPETQQALAKLARSWVTGRLMQAPDLHLTLAFLGSVEARQLPELLAIGEHAVFKAIPLMLDHAALWPHARIAWCGPGATPEPLTRLWQSLTEALEIQGFPRESRPFAPHITLARQARPLQAPEGLPIAWDARTLGLACATAPTAGRRYRLLHRWASI